MLMPVPVPELARVQPVQELMQELVPDLMQELVQELVPDLMQELIQELIQESQRVQLT